MLRKMTFLLWICLSPVLLRAQSQTLHGKIIDKSTGQAIVEAHVSLAFGQVAVTDKSGLFNLTILKLPELLRITHVSYGIIEYPVESIPDGVLVIRIEPEISAIAEVQISAGRLRILTKNEPFSIQEFAINDGLIWFIGHLYNQANEQRLFLANLYGDTLKSMPIQRAQNLYQDVFGSVHIVFKDSVYQLFSPAEDSISLLYGFERNRFFSIMDNIEAAFAHKLVYVQKSMRQNGLTVFYIQEDDPHQYLLTTISDTLEAERARVTGKTDKLMDYYGIPELANMWTTVMRYTKRGTKFDAVIRHRVPYEVFNVDNKLYILNYLKDSLLTYTSDGKFADAIPIDFHKEKKLGDVDYRDLLFLSDPISKEVYLLERGTSHWNLQPVDLLSGKTDFPIQLPDFPGMEGICVYNQAVYFTYYEKMYPYYTRLYRYQM